MKLVGHWHWLFLIISSCFLTGSNTENWLFQKLFQDKSWKGSWFPNSPGMKDVNSVVTISKKPYDSGIHSSNSSVVNTHTMPAMPFSMHKHLMGVSQSDCDDGKTNLTLDWDHSADSYICFDENWKDYIPELYVQPILHCDHVPSNYIPLHECMYTPITYADDIPTYGDHRPLWPKYGEYQYLPPQRWLHSLEHGAIVMLYHPCANPQEVQKLKKTVRNCLYRHIITPSNKLTPERPVALVTWGCKLLMSKVNVKIAQEFIRTSALKGPEIKYENGQFDYALINDAKIVTDKYDSQLCP